MATVAVVSSEIIAFVRGELLQAAPVEQHVLGEESTTSRVDRWKAWVAEHSATPSDDADATIMDDALAAIRKRRLLGGGLEDARSTDCGPRD